MKLPYSAWSSMSGRAEVVTDRSAGRAGVTSAGLCEEWASGDVKSHVDKHAETTAVCSRAKANL